MGGGRQCEADGPDLVDNGRQSPTCYTAPLQAPTSCSSAQRLALGRLQAWLQQAAASPRRPGPTIRTAISEPIIVPSPEHTGPACWPERFSRAGSREEPLMARTESRVRA